MKLEKLKNLHIYFFYLFLFSIPIQTRKVFLTEHSFYSGAFTEYATFFIYASDILLILTLMSWFIFNKRLYKYLNIENSKNARKLSGMWLLLPIFIIWLILSTIINNNYIEISVFYIFKFIELSLLIIYIYFNLKDKKRLITALFVVSFTGFLQGLIAIYQFVYQSPLFRHPLLHKLTGESTVYPQVSGIAKIIVDNEKLVRAYGTFPHPNLLGGFLIVSILISIYLLLKHKSYILSRLSFIYNNTNSNKSQIKTTSLLLSLFWIIFIFIQITALFFTFSRTAWMGFLISLFLVGMFYTYHFSIVSRETIRTIYFAFVKIIRKILFVDTFWIPAFAEMTKSKDAIERKGFLNKLKNRLNNNKIVSRETIEKNRIAKFVIVSLSNYDKFSVLPTLRQAQDDILRFINNKLLKRKLDNKIVSRETIETRDCDILSWSRNNFSNFHNVSRETISENLNDKKSVLLINNTDSSVSTRGQNCYYRLFYQSKELIIIVLLTLILTIIYFPHINSRINEELSINSSLFSSYLPSNYAFNDRIFYNNVSRETISENSTFGSGPGTFIFQINSYLTKNNIDQKLEPWQYQPAHNIYLLIISEIGIVGFIILALFIIKIMICNYKIIKKPLNKSFSLDNNSDNVSIVSRETISVNLNRKLNYYLLAILVSFLFIGLFDHYFWTLQQGRLMFWLVLGLMLANSNVTSKEDKY